MNPSYRRLRIRQVERTLRPFLAIGQASRPAKGWIRAIREATGMTLAELGRRMGTRPALQGAAQFERSEAEYRITLQNLRRAADALGCELVYAFVPKDGRIRNLAEDRAMEKARADVLAVEHTMALEDQAAGRVKAKIREETKRLLKG